MVKHIIFDLGNVLVNIHPQKVMKKFAYYCKLTKKQINTFYLSDIHLGFMDGSISTSAFYSIMMEKFSCNIPEDHFISIWNEVIGKPKNGIDKIIEVLSQRYELSICSNTDPWHWAYVKKRISFINLFSNYFLSFKMKVNKPNSKVFEILLFKLSANPEECIFIDDTHENTEVAKKMGFLTISADSSLTIVQGLKKYNLLPRN